MGYFVFSEKDKTDFCYYRKGNTMKRIITSVLILAFAVALLASCNEQEVTDISSGMAESSVVESTAAENSAFESSVAEDSSEEESKRADIVPDFEIPEFDINNVIYCETCDNITLDFDGNMPYPDFFGLAGLLHNMYAYSDYFCSDTVIPEDKYVYMAFSLYKEAKNKLAKEEMCEILEAFGYVENTEVNSFMDDEALATTTAGYIPYIAIEPLRKYLKENELAFCYTWLRDDCISNEECGYDYYNFGP